MLARSGKCLLQRVSKPAQDSQTVWSHWVRLSPGNLSEAGTITKIAILTGLVMGKSRILPSYLVRISKCEAGEEKREEREKGIGG